MRALAPADYMMVADLQSYLSEDIMAKTDRASMSVSLELREPLLDHHVVEFAVALPQSLKQRDGQGKWPLRQVAYRYVPEALLNRPKQGFEMPVGAWLRGPLREWAESLLDARRLAAEGYLNPQPIRARWREHLARHLDWQGQLWNVLMFQSWLAKEQEERAAFSAMAVASAAPRAVGGAP